VRALIGGVGYPDLSDHSFSWAVVGALESQALPDGVVVEDVSYNPVAVAQRLDDESPDRRFDVMVLVSAVPRGRPAGSITTYRWDRLLPSAEEIQRSVTDAVTGIIWLDNTLVVTRHLGSLPERVAVFEVEPLVEAFAAPMSDPVAASLTYACDVALRCATDAAFLESLPLCGLGGPVVEPRHV
jgi:hydrogenase maturation protease